MKYIVYSDYHVGHSLEYEPDFEYDNRTIMLGDNFDIRNVHRSRLEDLRAKREEAIEKTKHAGGLYLSGNHSLEPITANSYFYVRDNILYTHGDVIDRGYAFAKAYRLILTPGKGIVYRKLIEYKYRLLKEGILDLSKAQKGRAVRLATENSCNTIVMGHFHPRNGILDFMHDNIRIIVVSRGKSVLEL